ncbi:MAG: hypothetical protein N2690_10070, partial [Rhodocyclaceae bacterium]|nr:hypothetical protein [Rhodocyclaceae bacterium]
MNPLIERWRAWSARFAALQKREKLLIAGATVLAILGGGTSLWVEPAQRQQDRLMKTLGQQQAEQETLRSQLVALAQQQSDPDATNRALLDRLAQQLAATEQEIQGMGRAPVPPGQMPILLQT